MVDVFEYNETEIIITFPNNNELVSPKVKKKLLGLENYGMVAVQGIPCGEVIMFAPPIATIWTSLDWATLGGKLFVTKIQEEIRRKQKRNDFALFSKIMGLFPRKIDLKIQRKINDAMNLVGLSEEDAKLLSLMFYKVEQNVFLVRDKHSALYYTPSFINHSCNPNCLPFYDDETSTMYVKALRPIAVGDEITIPYTGISDYAQRSENLIARGIKCKCSNCVTKSELTVELTGLLRLEKRNIDLEVCIFCNTRDVKLFSCFVCKRVKYCSIQCQRANSMIHKTLCKRKKR